MSSQGEDLSLVLKKEPFMCPLVRSTFDEQAPFQVLRVAAVSWVDDREP